MKQTPRVVIRPINLVRQKENFEKSNKQLLLNNSSLSKMKIQEEEIFLYIVERDFSNSLVLVHPLLFKFLPSRDINCNFIIFWSPNIF